MLTFRATRRCIWYVSGARGVDPGTGKDQRKWIAEERRETRGTKSRGWTRRHRRAFTGLSFSDEPVGAFDGAPPSFMPINRDVIYPPDYRRFWMAFPAQFSG